LKKQEPPQIPQQRPSGDLVFELSLRERDLLLEAIIAWEGESCYTSREVTPEEIHRLLDKLGASLTVDRMLMSPEHRRPSS